jgi:hypothetical protein
MSHTTCVFGVSGVSVHLADLALRLAVVAGVSGRLPRPDEFRYQFRKQIQALTCQFSLGRARGAETVRDSNAYSRPPPYQGVDLADLVAPLAR